MLDWVSELIKRYGGRREFEAGGVFLLGRVLHSMVGFLSIPLFVYLLSVDDYGLVSVFLTVSAIFGVLLPLNLNAAVSRANFDFSSHSFNRYNSSNMCLGVFTSLLGIAILAALPQRTHLALFHLDKTVTLLAAFNGWGLYCINTALGVWRIHLKARPYVGLTISSVASAISLSMILVIWMDPNRGLGRMLGVSIVQCAIGVTLLLWFVRRGRSIIDIAHWRYALVFGLPLIPHVLANLLLAQSDRLMINHFLGPEMTGIYTLGYQIGELPQFIWYATNTVWVAWSYRMMRQGNYDIIQQKARPYLISFTAMTLILMVTVTWATHMLAPQAYRGAGPVVPVVMAGTYVILLYSFPVNLTFYAKRTGLISAATVLATAVNIGLNWWLLPKIGYLAAAWTTVIAYAVLFLLNLVIVRWVVRSPVRFDTWRMIGLGSLVVGSACILCHVFDP